MYINTIEELLLELQSTCRHSFDLLYHFFEAYDEKSQADYRN